MNLNISDVSGNTTGIITLYQNGTEYLTGSIVLSDIPVLGLDMLILVNLVEIFIVVVMLFILISRKW